MARVSDILAGLQSQAENGAQEVSKLRDAMGELRSDYLRYRDLETQVKEKEERVRIALGLLAARPREDREDGENRIRFQERAVEACETAGIPIESTPENEVRKVPLWRLMREVVRQVSEIQVVELEMILTHKLGIKTSRQAIESALETHKKTFRVVKRGREKFVSLK